MSAIRLPCTIGPELDKLFWEELSPRSRKSIFLLHDLPWIEQLGYCGSRSLPGDPPLPGQQLTGEIVAKNGTIPA